jgi:hypothetical protein
MARNANIPVKSVHGHVLFYVSFFKAVELLKEKDAAGGKLYRDVTHWVHGKGRPMPVLQMNAPMREEHQSPCSITRSVMEANAGTDGSQAFQRQSRALVAAYPFIGDTLAVRVCPA